jgi:hypothetical protein
LIEYFEQKCTNFKAGRTTQRFSAWRNLTSDKTILDSIRGITIPLDELPQIRGITIPLDELPQQHRVNLNPKFSPIEALAINNEVERLLATQVIELAPHEPGEIIFPIFVREKKDGRFRLTLNLKEFNKSVTYTHFKIHTLQTTINLIPKIVLWPQWT